MQYSSAAESGGNCVPCFTLRLIFIFLTLLVILLVNMDILLLTVGTAALTGCLSYCTNDNELDVYETHVFKQNKKSRLEKCNLLD